MLRPLRNLLGMLNGTDSDSDGGNFPSKFNKFLTFSLFYKFMEAREHYFYNDKIPHKTSHQTFVLMKTSFVFVFIRRLQDVLVKTNIFVWAIRLQDVFKTFSRRLQDVLQKHLHDIFKTSSRRFENVFKTSSRPLARISSRRIIKLNCFC